MTKAIVRCVACSLAAGFLSCGCANHDRTYNFVAQLDSLEAGHAYLQRAYYRIGFYDGVAWATRMDDAGRIAGPVTTAAACESSRVGDKLP